MDALQALECPVCLNTLDEQHKVLGCQHTFCTDCLEILHDEKNGHVRCPECRHLNFVTSVAHLPNNILLMRLLQSMNDKQAKKEEEKESSSDDEPVVVRRKVVKQKRKFRKIRAHLSLSDEEPVIKESDSEEEKKPVIKYSDSETEDKKPVIESESEQEDNESAVKKPKASKSGSSSSSSSSSSDGSDSSDSEDGHKKDSGSATDNYFSDSEQKKSEALKRLGEEEQQREEEERRRIWEIMNPLSNLTKQEKETLTPEEQEKESRKRSGRLAEKYKKVFRMPNRKSVLDSIPSTSMSPQKACAAASKFRPRRRVNDFTKINSSYNKDPDYTDESEAEEIIKDSPSEYSDDSYYSDDSTKPFQPYKKKRKSKSSKAKKSKKKRRRVSVSDDEKTDDYGVKSDGSDEYIPPSVKKTSTPRRIKRAPQFSDDDDYAGAAGWCSEEEDERYQRREPVSRRQQKRVRDSIESGSRFQELKRQRDEEKKAAKF